MYTYTIIMSTKRDSNILNNIDVEVVLLDHYLAIPSAFLFLSQEIINETL